MEWRNQIQPLINQNDKKTNSPPPRQGPSARRQAANKNKRDNQGKPAHLHPQLEINKLPDLVVNSNKLSEFTGVNEHPGHKH